MTLQTHTGTSLVPPMTVILAPARGLYLLLQP